MYAVTVTFKLGRDQLQGFLPLVIENARLSLDEPACQQFDVCADPKQPNTVFLYELYDDLAGFEMHLATAHFKDFDGKVEHMVMGKKVICFSEVLK